MDRRGFEPLASTNLAAGAFISRDAKVAIFQLIYRPTHLGDLGINGIV